MNSKKKEPFIKIGDQVLVVKAGDVKISNREDFYVDPQVRGKVGVVVGATMRWGFPILKVVFKEEQGLVNFAGELSVKNGQYLPFDCVKIVSSAPVVDKEYEDLLI